MNQFMDNRFAIYTQDLSAYLTKLESSEYNYLKYTDNDYVGVIA